MTGCTTHQLPVLKRLPATLGELSRELCLGVLIYRSRTKPTFTKLVVEFERRKLGTRSTVSKSLDLLFDQGMVTADWERHSDGRMARTLAISHHVSEFFRGISEHVNG